MKRFKIVFVCNSCLKEKETVASVLFPAILEEALVLQLFHYQPFCCDCGADEFDIVKYREIGVSK